MESNKTTVAIIGAGCSGLTAIKECVAQGLQVVCFEQANDIGGLWKYEEPVPGKQIHSSVYKNTIINTSKPMMTFSDFPIPHEWPTFLHNRNIMNYFSSYTDHFNLRPFIQFGVNVKSVHPKGKSNSDENGAGPGHVGEWEIIYEKDGQITTQVFDKVIVATGHHWKPNSPTFEGIENFEGEVLHSHYYREAHPFKDRKCVVVGIGNSAVDIAVELSFHAKQVYLSTRRSAWVVPRYTLTGAPADQVLNRVFFFLPMFLRNLIFRLTVWLHWGNMSRFGCSPQFEPFSAHATVNAELFPRIGTGMIKMQKNIKRFLKNQIEFEDGSIVDADVVFLCTGYEIGYPFLDSQRICGLEPGSNSVKMYKFVFPIRHKNIAFIGLVQPYGSIMPISEIQSRWVASVFANKGKPLPNRGEMIRDIYKVESDMKDRYLTSQRHTIQVDAGIYMDKIAKHLDVTPNLFSMLFTDPWLWYKCVFGCWSPHQYRLQGPGSFKGARDEILKANSGYDYKTYIPIE